jgi:hypothetical protein
MTCDHHQHALLELAARGAEPDPELSAHLQACSSCHSAFENERSLFASIDSCLRSSANAEIPPSFIPAVRAHLQREVRREVQRESPTARGSSRVTDRLVWASAFAAAAFILFFFARLDHPLKPQSRDDQFATQPTESPVAPPTTAAAKPPRGDSPRIAPATGKRFTSKAVIVLNKNSLQAKNREPEIIVPPDQEILLARYADQFRRRHRASSTFLAEIAPDQTDPLLVPLIQIAELDVKPLASDQQIGQHIDQKIDQTYDQK